MKETIKTADMLAMIQCFYDEARKEREMFDDDDERGKMRMHWCIGMKELAEALIEEPVNLRRDGKVTVGF